MDIKQLEAGLKQLRLSSFINRYENIAARCLREKLDFVDYLGLLVDAELEDRYHKKVSTLLKKSKLPLVKDIQDFETSRIPGLSQSLVNELSKGNFIDRAENLLIFGNPGTGKTHLAIALVQEWCNSGRKVLFTTASELIQELLKAKRMKRWNEFMRGINKNDVIVIDDISYVACDRQETDLLFLLLASRYELKSIVITSNLAFADWGSIFKDKITTSAAIDKLIHHSTILKLNAESYRKESAKKKQMLVERAGSK